MLHCLVRVTYLYSRNGKFALLVTHGAALGGIVDDQHLTRTSGLWLELHLIKRNSLVCYKLSHRCLAYFHVH